MTKKYKIIIVAVGLIIAFGIVYAIWQEEKTGMFFANNLGYSCTGAITSARSSITGECKDFPSGCYPSWYKFDLECMEEFNQRVAATQTYLKTYKNDKYSFEVQYFSDQEIKEYAGDKISEFSACENGQCSKFLVVFQEPLEATGFYTNYIKLDPPASLYGIYYYYLTDEKVGNIPEIKNSFKFIEAVAQTDTSTWKTYRNEKYGFEVKYPEDWPVQTSVFSIDLHPPGLDTNQINGISVIAINYNETPPNPVVYSYTRIRTIDVDGSETLVKKRTPGAANEVYIAEITKGDITVEFRFYANRKYDDVFDQILSTFKFLK